MISILDYGAGNLPSVENALLAIGAPYQRVNDRSAIAHAAKIILPGVGNFGQIARALDAMDLRSVLIEQIGKGVPFLGICLGLQILLEGSEEAPEARGLGIVPGTVRRFPGELRVPHMGWNEVTARPKSRLIQGSRHFYFANSYYAPLIESTSAICEYGNPFTAALEQKNIYGVQFHPEKSGAEGLAVLRRFAEIGGC